MSQYVEHLRLKAIEAIRLAEPLLAHGSHDQSTHGNRDGATESAGTPGGARAGEIIGNPGDQLSTARPSAVGTDYQAGDVNRLGYDTIPDDAVKDVVANMSRVPGFERFAGRTDRAALKEIAKQQSENIEERFKTALEIGLDTSAAHADWYPFVNRWAHEQAAALGMEPEAIMGALAALSPSADWANNVAWAKQVAEIIKNEKTIKVAPEWLEAQEIAAQAAHKVKIKDHEKANAALVAEGKEPKPFTIKPPVVGQWAHLAGQQLSELSDREAAVAIRGAHELYGKVVHQLGGMAGLGDAENIATPQKLDNFAKAISILRNPTTANIDVQLGSNHKVRSFYQNMRDPYNTKQADVTVDSHHMGLAIGIPLPGNHPLMKSIYDGPTRRATGLVGTYPLTVEATRLATTRINKRYGTNYTPAQVQSITWEAQRALYNQKPSTLIAKIGAIQSLYRSGKIPKNEMLARVENVRLSGKASGNKNYRNPTLEEIRKGFLDELGKGT